MKKLRVFGAKSITGGFYWYVKTPTSVNAFEEHQAAILYASKFCTRWRKEHSAYSMVSTIAVNLLNVADSCFVQKLLRSKCKGISQSQYGYLKGIHERQERAW